jgi:hypothetical protein
VQAVRRIKVTMMNFFIVAQAAVRGGVYYMIPAPGTALRARS